MKNFVSERVLEDFYNSISSGSSKMVHIPKSDVFYVRDHLRAVFGKNFTLDYVEWALLKEGMINPRDCFEPELKKSWDEYPLEKESSYKWPIPSPPSD
jgi:hypothetical protein